MLKFNPKHLFMESLERYLPWSIRILIAGLFLISAYGKVYPDPSAYGTISMFEIKQLYPMGFNPFLAKIFSRSLIGFEFGLGLLILFPFDLKKWVIPTIIGLLSVFVVQLSYELMTKGNVGNCGCFGALLPMTPLEAILKNLLSIGLLALLYTRYAAQLPTRSNFWVLTTVALASMLVLFMAVPTYKETTTMAAAASDTPTETMPTNPKTDPKATLAVATTEAPKDTSAKKVQEEGPKAKKSGFAAYYSDIDKGKKLLCFFAPSCDHCRATAKALTAMKATAPDLPPIQILFMDEAAEEIPDFFKFAGASYPYKVLDIIKFWEVLGGNRDVPGVAYLWNGNVVKFYHSPEGPSAFNKEDLKTQLQKQKLRP
ncbi:MAG: hypothetical protein RLZZ301_968 [Bacteroidota bacterium]